MGRALDLAESRIGRTGANPSVGCLLLSSSSPEAAVLGWGVTGYGGRPHAEEEALAAAGGRSLSGAEVYVTLEPCSGRSHGGPSCAARLIEAGVGRVVIGCSDPHSLGGGRHALIASGVPVRSDICLDRALMINIGFFTWVRRGRPFVGIDSFLCGYDGLLVPAEGESAAEALGRMGRAGHRRVRVSPDSLFLAELYGEGLVDFDGREKK